MPCPSHPIPFPETGRVEAFSPCGAYSTAQYDTVTIHPRSNYINASHRSCFRSSPSSQCRAMPPDAHSPQGNVAGNRKQTSSPYHPISYQFSLCTRYFPSQPQSSHPVRPHLRQPPLLPSRHPNRLRRRRKLTLLPDLGTMRVKQNRNRDHDHRDAAQQRPGPIDVQRVEHVGAEEGEDGGGEGAEECVCCYGGGGAGKEGCYVRVLVLVWGWGEERWRGRLTT
jgi:hypothetical protein